MIDQHRVATLDHALFGTVWLRRGLILLGLTYNHLRRSSQRPLTRSNTRDDRHYPPG